MCQLTSTNKKMQLSTRSRSSLAANALLHLWPLLRQCYPFGKTVEIRPVARKKKEAHLENLWVRKLA
jgi:hypothetical protein